MNNRGNYLKIHLCAFHCDCKVCGGVLWRKKSGRRSFELYPVGSSDVLVLEGDEEGKEEACYKYDSWW